MKTTFSVLILAFLVNLTIAQDINFARKLLDTLCSPSMNGRGYVNNGDQKAAQLLANEFAQFGLLSFQPGYFQKYSFPMNTFPGVLKASANNEMLISGKDYQVWAATPSMKGTFKVVELTPKLLKNSRKLKRLAAHDNSDKFVLVDKKGIHDKSMLSLLDSLKYDNFLHVKGIINVSDTKLVWSVAMGSSVSDYAFVDLKREALPKKLKTFSLEVESVFVPKHQACNVIGYVKGRVEADTFLVLSAHYDHLGRMGSDVYYPGANDNASGTTMVTDLAKFYSKEENRPYYSIIFMLFSGEEAGLLGSKFCAAHPPISLKKIKFLVNLDMVGTGSEGITVVNANKYKEAFQRITNINTEKKYLSAIKERGESCNSDHCPFYKEGVPSIFIYSLGKEYSEYHNPDDKSSQLPLTEYNAIFKLVRDFMGSFAYPKNNN